MKYIEPLLEGGHPEDQMVFTFANADQCVLTRQMLNGLASWVELARFCSVTFEGTRPTQIVGAVQVCSLAYPLFSTVRLSVVPSMDVDICTYIFASLCWQPVFVLPPVSLNLLSLHLDKTTPVT